MRPTARWLRPAARWTWKPAGFFIQQLFGCIGPLDASGGPPPIEPAGDLLI
jgi:hypothetical protein